VIAGVLRFGLASSCDARGDLVAFEDRHNLPFPCKRVFTIRVGHGRLDRGGHANSCDEVIVVMAGSVLIKVDNGPERGEIRLVASDEAVWISGGVLIQLCDFAPGTVLMVCASQTYAETKHFPHPQFLPETSWA
jgi:WxcM-like, C-terminal.